MDRYPAHCGTTLDQAPPLGPVVDGVLPVVAEEGVAVDVGQELVERGRSPGHARDHVVYVRGGKPDLTQNLQAPLYVPETLTGMELLENFKQVRSPGLEMHQWSNTYRIPDPAGAISVLYGPNSGMQRTWKYWSAPEAFNKLVNTVNTTADPKERYKAFQSLLDVFEDERVAVAAGSYSSTRPVQECSRMSSSAASNVPCSCGDNRVEASVNRILPSEATLTASA